MVGKEVCCVVSGVVWCGCSVVCSVVFGGADKSVVMYFLCVVRWGFWSRLIGFGLFGVVWCGAICGKSRGVLGS